MNFYALKYRLQENFFPFLFASTWMAGVAVATIESFTQHKSFLYALGQGSSSWFYLAYKYAVANGII